MNNNFLRIWISASGIMTCLIGVISLVFVFIQTSGRFSWHRIGEMVLFILVALSGFAGHSGAKSLNIKGFIMFLVGSLLAAVVFFYFAGAALSNSGHFARKIVQFQLIAGISIILGIFFVHNVVVSSAQLFSMRRNNNQNAGSQSVEMGRATDKTQGDDLGKYLKFKNEKK